MVDRRDALEQQIGLTSVGIALWHGVGLMALDGRLTLDETRQLTETIMVWVSYERNGGNKTWTARELGKSRRVVRGIVRRWESQGGDTKSLPAALLELVAESSPPMIEAPAGPPMLAPEKPPEQFIDTRVFDPADSRDDRSSCGQAVHAPPHPVSGPARESVSDAGPPPTRADAGAPTETPRHFGGAANQAPHDREPPAGGNVP